MEHLQLSSEKQPSLKSSIAAWQNGSGSAAGGSRRSSSYSQSYSSNSGNSSSNGNSSSSNGNSPGLEDQLAKAFEERQFTISKVTFADPVVSSSCSAPTTPNAFSGSSSVSRNAQSSAPPSAPLLKSASLSFTLPSMVNPYFPSGADTRRAAAPFEAKLPEFATGIVDMDAYDQILALDDGDPSREFSKALVWAWCEQAEVTVAEIESALGNRDTEVAANKAQYLKGSSGSLGLVKVAATCHALHKLQFSNSLASYRFSFSPDYHRYDAPKPTPSLTGLPQRPALDSVSALANFVSDSSIASHSSSSSSSSSSTPSSLFSPPAVLSNSVSPPISDASTPSPSLIEQTMGSSVSAPKVPAVQQLSPSLAINNVARRPSRPGLHRTSLDVASSRQTYANMDEAGAARLQAAHALVQQLRAEITEACEWLYVFYEGSDKYAKSIDSPYVGILEGGQFASSAQGNNNRSTMA
ncbi:Phosphorelay intermediate protein [Cystobasidiomycetes sp. EMM_F5]